MNPPSSFSTHDARLHHHWGLAIAAAAALDRRIYVTVHAQGARLFVTMKLGMSATTCVLPREVTDAALCERVRQAASTLLDEEKRAEPTFGEGIFARRDAFRQLVDHATAGYGVHATVEFPNPSYPLAPIVYLAEFGKARHEGQCICFEASASKSEVRRELMKAIDHIAARRPPAVPANPTLYAKEDHNHPPPSDLGVAMQRALQEQAQRLVSNRDIAPGAGIAVSKVAGVASESAAAGEMATLTLPSNAAITTWKPREDGPFSGVTGILAHYDAAEAEAETAMRAMATSFGLDEEAPGPRALLTLAEVERVVRDTVVDVNPAITVLVDTTHVRGCEGEIPDFRVWLRLGGREDTFVVFERDTSEEVAESAEEAAAELCEVVGRDYRPAGFKGSR